MLYIIFAIIMFGILIGVHEFGHFIAAKLLDVKVNEFAIGMGPAIFTRQKGETKYSLRLLPVGGYCAMEGEDAEVPDEPRAFNNKAPWRRLIILVAGSFMNFLTGLLVLVIVLSTSSAFVTNEIVEFADGCPYESESGLQVGDHILKIDGERIYTYGDISTFLARGGDDSYDLLLLRDGERVLLEDYTLRRLEYVIDGETVERYGFSFGIREKNPVSVLRESVMTAAGFVRLVRVSLVDLVSGSVGVKDMSGPVGIVTAISQVGEDSEDTATGLLNVSYFAAFIAINLAVMNMLPLPALDGGRVFFLIVTAIAEKIRRKRIDPKYEGYVHAAGLVLLLALMAVVTFNDIFKLAVG